MTLVIDIYEELEATLESIMAAGVPASAIKMIVWRGQWHAEIIFN